MNRRIIALATAVTLSLAFTGMAQEAVEAEKKDLDGQIELLRKNVRAEKADLVAQNMGFDANEAAAFWPVYKQYEAERTTLGDARLAIIKEYAANFESLTDEKAGDLLSRAMDNGAAVLALEKMYAGEMLKVLPAKRVARFFQVDHRINLLIELETAAQIPLVW